MNKNLVPNSQGAMRFEYIVFKFSSKISAKEFHIGRGKRNYYVGRFGWKYFMNAEGLLNFNFVTDMLHKGKI